MDETLICPYCGQEQYGHEPDEITAFMCSTQCEHCGKMFSYSVTVTREYNATKDEAGLDLILKKDETCVRQPRGG